MKNFKAHALLCLLLLPLCLVVNSQGIAQTIRGKVIDGDSNIPLPGVNVLVLNGSSTKGTTSDANGEFVMANIPVGRVSLQISMLGYETKVIPNIVVGSGREVIVNAQLVESLIELEEAVVTQKQHKAQVSNDMALISARAFTVEETQRYAGTFNDPARMVSSYAGVANDPHGNNDIIVRGNSSKGIQWRLEGVEIPNPNHFAEEGMTGGPINALNSDVLANSNFLHRGLCARIWQCLFRHTRHAHAQRQQP
ncbi:MAG: carboxypeptidase-like regulatory domain-containing protein [Bacteroidales bacterium]|nr:carboxypeptidase-like regulatory domain-containing protein [Bacteroidales bacterium]